MKRSLRSWLWRVPIDQEVDEEITFHIDMRTRELIARGVNPKEARAIVISYDTWQQRLGGAPDVVGKSIHVDGEPRTILGVMPQGFNFPFRTQLWTPLDMSSMGLGERGSHSFKATTATASHQLHPTALGIQGTNPRPLPT